MQSTDKVNINTCSYCLSKNIKKDIPYGKFVTLKTNPFISHQAYAEICLDCGSILRSYIQLQEQEMKSL
ncbi:hypothetical protein [Alkaliphilus peptidifermentans]|uniref:Uncharacterized protein n=1 Tax=Alkaliphilus peptidifermentans DSM 18978 TaxID=1120976 RepID=A0A1G5D966_9FIRM|nr:hypothetical protein [Alkaliphilus peptidifermentans]SCY11164.1 hypothetical protein SAMN03080606_00835 [Alkaliphilus peptidifermentans DSM 18978]